MITDGIERTNFNYALVYAKTLSSNPTVVSELVQSFTLIAQNLGISLFNLIQQFEQGQDLNWIAAQLNSVRPRNALLGVLSNQNTPTFVIREIAA